MARARAGWIAVVSLVLWTLAGGARDVTALEVGNVEAEYWRGLLRLRLDFPESMVSWDIARAPLPPAITEPPLPCRWYWRGDTSLGCEILDDVMPVATEIEIETSPELWTQRGRRYPVQRVRVEMPRPRVHAWIHAWSGGKPEIRLGANQPIAVDALRRHLSLHGPDGALSFEWVEHEFDADDYEARWYGPRYFALEAPTFEPQTEYALHVLPALPAALGPLPGRQDRVLLRWRTGGAFEFRGARCDRYEAQLSMEVHCDPGRVILVFSEAFDPAPLVAWFAERAPAVRVGALDRAHWWASSSPIGESDDEIDEDDLRRVETAPGWVLSLEGLPPVLRLELDLAAMNLRGVGGRPLAAPARLSLNTLDHPPGYLVHPAVQLNLPDRVLGEAKLHVMNAKQPVRVSGFAFGPAAQTFETFVPVPADAETNVAWSVPLAKAVAADATVPLRVGRAGFDLEGPYAGHRFTLADAPFSVVALQGEGQFLAWIHEWGDGAPIAEADVEWIVHDPRTQSLHLEAGPIRTGGDGVVVLDYSATSDSRRYQGSAQMLRVRAGERQVLLPLRGEATVARRLDEAHPRRSNWYRETGWVAYAVTDKPIYRPGETLRYVLHLYRREGARLVPAPAGIQVEAALSGVFNWGIVEASRHLPQAVGDGVWLGEHVLAAHTESDEYSLALHIEGNNIGLANASFRVAAHRTADFRIEAAVPERIYAPGERLPIGIEAEFYSGGPLVGGSLLVQFLLEPMDPAELFPAFEDYAFATDDFDNQALHHLSPPGGLDRQGRAELSINLDIEQLLRHPRKSLDFGRLRVSASARSHGGWVNSQAVDRVFSRHPRLLGMRFAEQFLSAGKPVGLDVVALQPNGELDPDAAHSLTVAFGTPGEGDDVDWEDVAECEAAAAIARACDYVPSTAGTLRLTLAAPEAKPVSMERQVRARAPEKMDEAPGVHLELLTPEVRPGDPVRVRLTQPFGRANVLLTLEHARVLEWRTHWVDAAEIELEIATDPGFRGGASVAAHVQALDLPDWQRGAWIGIVPVQATAVAVTFATESRDLATLSLSHAQVRPGDTVKANVHPSAEQALTVSLWAVDMGLLDLAPKAPASWAPDEHGPLRKLQIWALPHVHAALGLLGGRVQEIAPEESADPATFYSEDTELDRIEVTGSRISAADLFNDEATPSARKADDGPRSRAGLTLPADFPARLREDFAEVAWWSPARRLEVGETLHFAAPLPDRLGTWRVFALVVADDGESTLLHADVVVAQPLELRLELPGKLVEGDRLAARAGLRRRDAGEARADTYWAARGGEDISDRAEVLLDEGQEALIETAEVTAEPPLAAFLFAARDDDSADALAGDVPVEAAEADVVVHGLGLLHRRADLRLPIPPGSGSAALEVTVGSPAAVALAATSRAMQDYPLQCLEQELSRARVARVASNQRGPEGAPMWADADHFVEGVLGDLGHYISEYDPVSYFPGGVMQGGLLLEAYAALSLARLEVLDRPDIERFLERLGTALSYSLERRPDRMFDGPTATEPDLLAMGLAAAGRLGRPEIHEESWVALEKDTDKLRPVGRAYALQALRLAERDPELQAVMRKALRATLRAWANGRVDGHQVSGYEMLGSFERDACVVLATLLEEGVGRSLRRDAERLALHLLERGATRPDFGTTIANAECSEAFVALWPSADFAGADVSLRLESHNARVRLDEQSAIAMHRFELAEPEAGMRLGLRSTLRTPLAHAFALRQRADRREMAPSALGFRLDRSVTVLRDGAWVDANVEPIAVGDWVRVEVRIGTGQPLHFMALEAPAPGGLRLQETALLPDGARHLLEAETGTSFWFDGIRLDATGGHYRARFLPPGEHVAVYFGQAIAAGEFTLLPAIAELMYSPAHRARTTATRIRIHSQP